jgi:DNA invertase Pin-like site-specific DNA recombinase
MKDLLHIYTRVSSSIQAEGTSLKTQREIGIKLAKQLGMDYEIHNEGGKSSANDDLHNRPVMLEILKLMDKGKVKHLFVYNTDRLSRNQITWYTIRQKMVANNVMLYTPKGIHDTNDSMENMILGIMNEIAVYDNKTRTDRSRLGKFEKVKQNYWRGGDPPFGYAIKKVEGGSRLAVNPIESIWVKYVFEQYAQRVPLKTIKLALEQHGIKTRRGNDAWSLGSLQIMLRNKVYTGVDEYYDKKFKETIRSEVPPIISDSLYNEVQERRESILLRKGQLSRTSKFYLLRDFMICGDCGTPFGGRQKAELNKKSLYYCPLAERKFNQSKDDGRVCNMKRSIHIESADKEIWDVIFKVITDSAKLKRHIESTNLLGAGLSSNKILQKRADIQSLIDELTNTKVKIEKGLVKVEAQQMMGEFDSPEIYKGVKKTLSSQLNSTKIQIEKAKVEFDQLGNHQLWFDWIDQFAKEFSTTQDLSNPQKRALINGVVKDVLVNYDQATKLHHVQVNFRLPVMCSLEEILLEQDDVLKRGRNSAKTARTLENTSLPERGKSALLHRDGILAIYPLFDQLDVHLAISVDYYSATLWMPHYSDYQQFLFDKIGQLRQDGYSYLEISQWMNQNNHYTSRGTIFNHKHAWSIYMKKRQSIKRFSRTFEPSIRQISVHII